MERRARRKARGRAMRSTLLLARVCACARFRLITSDYRLIALVPAGYLRFARMEQFFLNIVLIAMDG